MSNKVVIVGAGDVGFYLAKTLSQRNNSVTIIDLDSAKCQRARQNLDILVIEGNGAQAKVLHQAKTEEADIFLAVTRTDEVNIVACMKAKKMSPNANILARVRSNDYLSKNSVLNLQELGIDRVINPEMMVAKEIVHLVQNSIAQEIMTYANDELYMVALYPKDNSEIMGSSLQEIGLKYKELAFRTVAIERKDETIIPTGKTVFMKGDKIFVMCRKDRLEEMYRISGFRRERKLKNIMILGGSKLGRLVAEELSGQFNIRLIEHNPEKLKKIAKELPEVLLLESDGLDVDFMVSEGIADIDAFLAVTNNQTTNLFAGLMAKQLGADKAIVHVTTPEYLPIVHGLGINSVVSKNISTVDAFMRYVLRGRVHSVMMLEGIESDIIELSPAPESAIVGKPLKDIDFPIGAVIGAVIHPDGVEIATGDTVIGPNDRALVFTKEKKVSDVETLFD